MSLLNMADIRRGPIADSYWLVDGALLAGEYPATSDEPGTRAKLAKFLDAGIRTFVDLTESTDPLTKYDRVLRELSEERGIDSKHVRFGIRDLGVPRDNTLTTRVLSTIRDEIAAGRPVYVHCWGGVGRTGTMIGCWLVEQGMSGPAAIERIAELRRHTPDGHKRSPETDEQRQYICEWRRDREPSPGALD
jgi:protein tyrosine/serine phosphatase